MSYVVRQLGALPPDVIYPAPLPTTRHTLMALATLFGGLGTAMGIVLVAQGRAREAYPFAIAATVTGAVIGAAQVLGEGK